MIFRKIIDYFVNKYYAKKNLAKLMKTLKNSDCSLHLIVKNNDIEAVPVLPKHATDVSAKFFAAMLYDLFTGRSGLWLKDIIDLLYKEYPEYIIYIEKKWKDFDKLFNTEATCYSSKDNIAFVDNDSEKPIISPSNFIHRNVTFLSNKDRIL